MQKNVFSKTNMTVCALSLLVFAPGCWKSEKNNDQQLLGISPVNDGSSVLLTIDGQPYITEKSFQVAFDQLIASNAGNPQFQMMLNMLPNAKEEIFKGQSNEKIILYWAEKDGVTKTKEYQDKLEQGVKMLQVGLAAEFFQKEFNDQLKPTEEEMRAWYEEHKNPQLLVSPASFKALGVECSSTAEASTLYTQAKQAPKNFKSIAGASRVKDLAVSEFSFDVDAAIKDAVSTVTKFPTALSVTATDGKQWVVVVTGSEEAKYQPYEQIKQGLEQMVAREKVGKFYTERLNQLRAEYNVVEDTNAISTVSPEKEEAAEEAFAQALSQMDDASNMQVDASMDDADNADLPVQSF